MNEQEDKKTHCLEILLRCRQGLRLPEPCFVASHYTEGSLVAMFRYLDGKLYRLEIREVKSDNPNHTDIV